MRPTLLARRFVLETVRNCASHVDGETGANTMASLSRLSLFLVLTARSLQLRTWLCPIACEREFAAVRQKVSRETFQIYRRLGRDLRIAEQKSTSPSTCCRMSGHAIATLQILTA